MPRKEYEKVTLNLEPGDKDILAAFYPQLGWSVAARRLINNFCKKLRESEKEITKKTLEVELPEEESRNARKLTTARGTRPEESG